MKSNNAPITAVTVYPSGCSVKRVFKHEINQGSNEIILEGLTSELDPSSVRIKGTGNVTFRNDGQEVIKTTHLETPDEKIQELLGTIEELAKKRRAVNNRLECLSERQEWLEGIGEGFFSAYPVELAKGNSKAEDILFTGKIFDEKLTVKGDIDTCNDELAVLENTLRTVKSRLNKSKTKKASFKVKIFLENLDSKSGEVELELSYFCSRASWQSGYDLRLPENGDTGAEIDYNGFISNWTGEDWQGVEMILSTAAPTLGTTIPAFQPWYVDLYTPPPPSPSPAAYKMKAKKMSRSRAARPVMRDEAPMEMEILDEEEESMDEIVVTSSVEKTGENLVYRLSLPVDLPSDGKKKKQLIAREKVKLERSYYTYPARIQNVFQKGKVVNMTSMIFLPGEVSIFMGAEFAGKTSIAKILPKQSFTISLGESSTIKVYRKMKNKDVDKKGFSGKTRKYEVTYTIALQNLADEEVKITVLDSFPHPNHENIKVTLEDSSPVIKSGDLGKLEWVVDLPRLEKEISIHEMNPQISYTFTLEYPAQQTLQNFSI